MAWPPRFNITLRIKLAVLMATAALLPLLVVVGISARLTVGRLERGVETQTRETARIALNLLLRRVQRLSAETIRLASDPELHELVTLEPELVTRYLRSRVKLRTTGLVEVVLLNHGVAGRAYPQNSPTFKKYFSKPDSPALVRALDFQRYLSVDKIGGQMVIRTSAPIVDSMFTLRGALVATLPMDDQMTDFIRGVVRADIGFLVGARPVASTYVDESGLRSAGVSPPPALVKLVRSSGQTALTVRKVGAKEYAVAFAPLQTVDGRRIGMMSVGVSRQGVLRARASSSRYLFLGGLGGLIFALVIAYVVGRRITVPLSHLHHSAQAIASGNLDIEVAAETDDEIGDLARAFQKMTVALKEHEDRLAARMQEISTLHQIGRAVGSVLGLDIVLDLIIVETTKVLGAERGTLLLMSDDGELEPMTQVGLSGEIPGPWKALAEQVMDAHGVLVEGELLGVPLETRERPVGALVIARRPGAGTFSESDLRLLETFCDQAAAAIENSRLFEEVRTFSEELEQKVQKRTAELQLTLEELKEAQTQLIHSEKMAGLGTLVAGVAHEINTPAAAIQGSIQTLAETLQRLMERMKQLFTSGLDVGEVDLFLTQVVEVQRNLRKARPISPKELRRQTHELGEELGRYDVQQPRRVAKRLLEAGARSMAETLVKLTPRVPAELMVGLTEDLAFLQRSSRAIQASIQAIVRLVGTLKNYAHTDQADVVNADLTEGLETTLTILHNQLRYGITVTRLYGQVQRVPVVVDQLNQVWTNLIMNAVQAMKGEGEIIIETFQEGDEVGVRITDNGPGIPAETLPRIFEPFYTTKPRGEGTGLGLSIVHKIIDRHAGSISVESEPGETSITILLPIDGPLRADDAGDAPGESDA